MANPMETIAQFSALIELMKDPAKIATLVDEAKKVRDDNEKYVVAKAKIDEVDAYVKASEADLDKKYAQLDADIAEQNAKVDKFYQVSTQKGSELAAKEEQLLNKELKVAQREEAVTKREKDVEKAFNDTQALQVVLDKREQALIIFKQELEAKAAKIAAIVG